MAAGKRKISKTKGVEICSDMMYSGQERKDIVPKLTEEYGVSVSCVEKWMRAAQPFVRERRARANEVKQKEEDRLNQEAAQRLNISREWVLEQYHKLASFDPRKVFTVDGGMIPIKDWKDAEIAALAGIESYTDKGKEGEESLGTLHKIKLLSRKDALDSICRVLGYNAKEFAGLPGEEIDAFIIKFR